MNAGPRKDVSVRPSLAAGRLHIASMEPVRVGMPELCRAGLSETWLMKACGHRHWLALAQAHGLSVPDFRDANGARLYPAFTSVRLADGCLENIREDDRLEFQVTLVRIGRTRFRSIIQVRRDDENVACVTMESAFVRRTIKGRNRSAARCLVAGPCGLLSSADATPPLRIDGWDRLAGFCRTDRAEIATHLIDPSPHEDFNGADFLYFAAFQAMLDRAEWHWFHHSDPLLVTTGRQIFYTGNIELGDQVRTTLCGIVKKGGNLSHWIEIARSSDGEVIALGFTQKRFVERSANDAPLRRSALP